MIQFLSNLHRWWHCRTGHHVWTVSSTLAEGRHPIFGRQWQPSRSTCRRCGKVST